MISRIRSGDEPYTYSKLYLDRCRIIEAGPRCKPRARSQGSGFLGSAHSARRNRPTGPITSSGALICTPPFARRGALAFPGANTNTSEAVGQGN